MTTKGCKTTISLCYVVRTHVAYYDMHRHFYHKAHLVSFATHHNE